MNKDLQYKKASQKLNLITELIEALSNYNNIKGYTNQKKFTIDISYRKEFNNSNYFYNINIKRGTNNPKTIFNMRFVYFENINKMLENLIEKLTKNGSFSYTSFSSGYNYNEYSSYNINLKNNVEVKIDIKSQEDLENFLEIEKQFSKKEVIIKPAEETNKTKDELQEEKMINIIEILHKILNILEEYNNIEDYSNKKPFSFNIKNHYNYQKECYVFTFTIIRGNNKPETFLTLNASIKNKNIFYNKIYDLLMNFKQKESFFIESTTNNNYNEAYSISTKNNISLNCMYGDEQDKNFYKNFKEETNSKKQEFDLTKTQTKSLTHKL